MSELKEEENTQTDSAWPPEGQIFSHQQCFDDNFIEANVNLNENGLELPDSDKYIHALEKKLTSLRSFCDKTCGSNFSRQFSKQIIDELASKKDDLFQSYDIVNKSPDLSNEDDVVDKGENNSSLCNAITQLSVYETIERKLFPQNHAIDPEELKNLPKSDQLQLLHNNSNVLTVMTEDSVSH